MKVEPNRAYTIRSGEIHQRVDVVRLAVADRHVESNSEGPLGRRSAVWKFWPARRGNHFFVTSSHLQTDMKGTVHPKVAHFGFSQHQESYENWLGPQPESRHLHKLKIRDLREGDHQHILFVQIPGFALMSTPQPFDPGKIVTWSDPHPPNFEVTFALTVVQGDWRSFAASEGNFVTIGLLTGENDRHALISFGIAKYEDVSVAMANMERNLALIPNFDTGNKSEELTAVFWMERQDHEPIRIVELSAIENKPT